MAGLINRLKQWSEIQKVRPVEEAADVTGGRDGELLLRQLIGGSFPFKGTHLFPGRRIPSKRQGRKREIDLIVCTPQMIHLIEVKNWSGQLEVRNGYWRQTRRSGDVVDHGNLIETNLLKRDAVVEYLHDKGVSLDDRFVCECIVPKIIFMNPNLQLDPAVEARDDVISRRELDGFLGKQPKKGFAERMFSSIIETCLHAESKLTSAVSQAVRGRHASIPYEKIVTLLSEVGTWDQLQFYGSKVETGDVLVLKLGPKVYRESDLIEQSKRLPIRLKWTRSRFWGLLKAITGLGSLGKLYLGKLRINVTPSDTVTFHAVGDREARSHRLVEIDQIVVGP